MSQPASVLDAIEAVRRALREEPRLGPGFALSRIEMEGDGVLALEGNVARLAQKKLALLHAAKVPGVTEVIDRLHVIARAPADDRHIRAQMRELFAQDGNFSDFQIREDVAEGVVPTAFKPVTGGAAGCIDIEVNDGIVTLNGTVPTLVHKRLAGVMAWWNPGVRDVVNGIAVEPGEEDSPDQIEEAVRVALDRNPAIEAGQIKVGVRGRIVRLTGLMQSGAARQVAENDAWATFGVDDVINEIEVRP
ncbi:MAG: BON domain-containing protein [Alphaproteobacteria bacterium]|nr:BON domain-containing protein [Alphaproteobacteria bacterium]